MVSKDGFVKILDFGLAKLTEPVVAGRVRRADGDRGADAARAPSWARPATCRPSRRAASPWTSAPTSSRWARSSTRWPRASARSSGRRAPRRSSRSSARSPSRSAQLAPEGPGPRALDRRALLAKDPEERYASTKDLARDLKSVRDHLTETSALRRPRSRRAGEGSAGAAGSLPAAPRARCSEPASGSCCAEPRTAPAGLADPVPAADLPARADRSPRASLPTARRSSTAPPGRAARSRSSRRGRTAPSRARSGCPAPTSSSISSSGELAVSLEPPLPRRLRGDRDARPRAAGRRRAPRGPRERPGRRLVARRQEPRRVPRTSATGAGSSTRSARSSTRPRAGSAASASPRTGGSSPSSTTRSAETTTATSRSWTRAARCGSTDRSSAARPASPGRRRATRSGSAESRRLSTRTGKSPAGLELSGRESSRTSLATGACSARRDPPAGARSSAFRAGRQAPRNLTALNWSFPDRHLRRRATRSSSTSRTSSRPASTCASSTAPPPSASATAKATGSRPTDGGR